MGLVQMVGGPRDGELVGYEGPVLYEAMEHHRSPLGTRAYDLHHWCDLDGRDEPSWRYVLREQVGALGGGC